MDNIEMQLMAKVVDVRMIQKIM